MGCDIHCYAEVRKNGAWGKVGKIFKNSYYRPERETTTDGDGFTWNAELIDEPFDGRNYDLFAMLADVRNGRGFAGCDTGDGFKPIAMPKGLPDDVSAEVKQQSDEWGCDGHSHSWFTVAELLAYDWKGQKTIHRAFISLDDYPAFKEGKRDIEMCGGVSGRSVIQLKPSEAEMILSGIKHRTEDMFYYVSVSYEESYYESVAGFVDDTIPSLQVLGAPEDVRIVFWFDN